MTAAQQPATTGTVAIGPVWRDSNVRTGPTLESPIVQLLLPGESDNYDADAWTVADEVVEGTIVSDLWFRLPQGWCSAVNFNQGTIGKALASGRVRQIVHE